MSTTGSFKPLERGTIVGLESRKTSGGKLGPQQRNQIESRPAPVPSEELAHQAFRPVSANRTPYSTRCDDPQSASVEAVRKREQSQVAATDARTLALYAEKLFALSNPVAPGQGPIHVPGRPDRLPEGGRKSITGYTERRLRPFARRRLRISLPIFVLIRLRKPCVRFRRRLFG